MPQRYATLAELVQAHREGSLPTGAHMLIDADGAFLDGDVSDEGEELFAGDLQELLRDALMALGLPAEVCPPIGVLHP